MNCPACGWHKTECDKTINDSSGRWRFRSCPCGATFQTREVVIKNSLRVVTGNPPATTRNPPATRPQPPGNPGGVGGGLCSGSGSDPVFPDPSQQSLQVKPRARKNTPRTKPEPEYSLAFVAFWAVYPRKVAKGAAWGAWQSWSCDGRAEEIMAVLKWQVPEDFDKREYEKVPHPATWINARGWENERPAARVAPNDRNARRAPEGQGTKPTPIAS